MMTKPRLKRRTLARFKTPAAEMNHLSEQDQTYYEQFEVSFINQNCRENDEPSLAAQMRMNKHHKKNTYSHFDYVQSESSYFEDVLVDVIDISLSEKRFLIGNLIGCKPEKVSMRVIRAWEAQFSIYLMGHPGEDFAEFIASCNKIKE